MQDVEQIVELLQGMMEDDGIPRSVNLKLKEMVVALESSEEISLCLNKAMCDLEELSNDVNIPGFVRTQLWGVMSMLAALEARIVKA